MAGLNRHLYGDTMEIKATIRSTVTVSAGDFMIMNGQANMITQGSLSGASTTADNYAYPWGAGHFAAAATSVNTEWFIGVAMDDSANGSTDTIAIATAGVFRFPLTRKSATTIGTVIGGTTRPGTFSTTAGVSTNYTVYNATTGSSVCYCVETSNTTRVSIVLRSRMGPGGTIS